jgi:hypothetical protein
MSFEDKNLYIRVEVYRANGSKVLQLGTNAHGPAVWVAPTPDAVLVDLNGGRIHSLLVQPNPSDGQLLSAGIILEP